MHSRLFAAAGVAAALFLAPASADASCCDQAKMHAQQKTAGAPCCDMPCCADHAMAVEPKEVDVLAMLPLDTDVQLFPAPPVRQLTEIWFQRPVRVGRHILQGRYVIEHDNDRMARGEPCTHIYAYNDQKNPVVTFHCTHLERDRNGTNTAVLATIGDGTMQQLLEFQFAGEHAAHGVPSGR
jgi:hypothetical protein